MAIILSETWTGSNGAAWPAGWTSTVDTGGTVDIQSNQGRMASGTTAFTGWARSSYTNFVYTDLDIAIDYVYPAATDQQWPAVYFRTAGTWQTGGYDMHMQNGYSVRLLTDNDAYGLYHHTAANDNGALLTAGITLVQSASDTVHLRISCIGATIKVRAWKNAAAEPSTWDISLNNTLYKGFGFGLSAQKIGGNAGISDFGYWDNLVVTQVASAFMFAPSPVVFAR